MALLWNEQKQEDKSKLLAAQQEIERLQAQLTDMPRLQQALKKERGEKNRAASRCASLEKQVQDLRRSNGRPGLEAAKVGVAGSIADAAALEGSDAPDWLRE